MPLVLHCLRATVKIVCLCFPSKESYISDTMEIWHSTNCLQFFTFLSLFLHSLVCVILLAHSLSSIFTSKLIWQPKLLYHICTLNVYLFCILLSCMYIFVSTIHAVWNRVVVYLWRGVPLSSTAENTDQCSDFKLLDNKVFRNSDRKKTEHGHTVALIQCLLF